MRDFNNLTKNIPDWGSIIGVFAILITLIYSWTLIASFYALPSWIYFLDLSQIFSVYSYSFVLDFIESISALAAVLLLEFIINSVAKVDRGEFRTRSLALIFVVMISSGIRLYKFKGYEEMAGFIQGETSWWVGTLLACIIFGIFTPKVKLIRRFFDQLADRAIIFLYIYLPISALSLVVVMVRNIF